MIQEIKKITSSRRELRNFGIVIGLVLLGISLLLFFKDHTTSFKLFAISGTLFVLSGLIIPRLLVPLYWPWMIFAVIIGWVMTRVILTLLFFLVITPIGIVTRLFGLLSINVKWREDKNTYWCVIDRRENERQDLEKQF